MLVQGTSPGGDMSQSRTGTALRGHLTSMTSSACHCHTLHRQKAQEITPSSISLLETLLTNAPFPRISPVGNSDGSPAHDQILISGIFGAVIAPR